MWTYVCSSIGTIETPSKRLCAEYLSSLNWRKHFFNPSFNRCYCKDCYPSKNKDTFFTGDAVYVIPRDWCRFGLQVDQVRAAVDQIWEYWVVTYHGTSPIAAQSIITHRQFLLPGDKCIDGSEIEIRPEHIPGKKQIYTSPTIAYSSLPSYCPRQRFRSTITKRWYNARLVLQCRQDPDSFRIQGETVSAHGKRICPIIPNDQIELLTTIRASIVPYGVLIHLEAAAWFLFTENYSLLHDTRCSLHSSVWCVVSTHQQCNEMIELRKMSVVNQRVWVVSYRQEKVIFARYRSYL